MRRVIKGAASKTQSIGYRAGRNVVAMLPPGGRAIATATNQCMINVKQRLAARTWELLYSVTIFICAPVNAFLVFSRKSDFEPQSVIHIGYGTHVIDNLAEMQRQLGAKANVIAIGPGGDASRADYHIIRRRFPVLSALRDLRFFWKVVSKHSVVHSHSAMTLSSPFAWDMHLMRRLGRKVVLHYRGCEARDRIKNMALHPDVNICQECDYSNPICERRENVLRRDALNYVAETTLVTTPDLRDFAEDGIHVPFICDANLSPVDKNETWSLAAERPLKLVHATNQPGIEGTRIIQRVVAKLVREGFPIELEILTGVPYSKVISSFRRADLAIGKMKMGYYANAQVEAMALGVPVVTCIRDEFLTDSIVNESGMILCGIDDLYDTLRDILERPEVLEERGQKAAGWIQRNHGKEVVMKHLESAYGW